MAARRRLIDIGANLTDPMFRGLYNGSRKHPDDLDQVLQRAQANGVHRMLVTGGSLEDSRQALELASAHGKWACCGALWAATQPGAENSRARTARPTAIWSSCRRWCDKVPAGLAALGEMGLDYERLQPHPTCSDVLRRNRGLFTGAVVHSFDGSKEEAAAFLDLGLFIGINGCSLKTAENLAVAATIPRDRLLIETDCPWCEIRPTHAGAKLIRTSFPAKKKERFEPGFMVKGRNEPANLV
ncbi:hypothetical protein MTO96_036135 [Rhipicephalus appendiculatus]